MGQPQLCLNKDRGAASVSRWGWPRWASVGRSAAAPFPLQTTGAATRTLRLGPAVGPCPDPGRHRSEPVEGVPGAELQPWGAGLLPRCRRAGAGPAPQRPCFQRAPLCRAPCGILYSVMPISVFCVRKNLTQGWKDEILSLTLTPLRRESPSHGVCQQRSFQLQTPNCSSAAQLHSRQHPPQLAAERFNFALLSSLAGRLNSLASPTSHSPPRRA